jgi:hypothetical protein
MCVKTKQYPKPHQIPKLHPKLFPLKNNLKIKLMKCFNPIQIINHLHLALLNLCHSHDNSPLQFIFPFPSRWAFLL